MTANPVYRFDGWVFDTGRRTLTDPNGDAVAMASTELALLRVLCEHPQEDLSRQFLAEATYRYKPALEESYGAIAAQVYQLRRKLEVNAAEPQIIKATRGGYWFCPVPEIVPAGPTSHSTSR